MQIRPATVPPVNGVCVCVYLCVRLRLCVYVCVLVYVCGYVYMRKLPYRFLLRRLC